MAIGVNSFSRAVAELGHHARACGQHAQIEQQQSLAIGRRLGHIGRADVAVAAGLVLDRDVLPEHLPPVPCPATAPICRTCRPAGWARRCVWACRDSWPRVPGQGPALPQRPARGRPGPARCAWICRGPGRGKSHRAKAGTVCAVSTRPWSSPSEEAMRMAHAGQWRCICATASSDFLDRRDIPPRADQPSSYNLPSTATVRLGPCRMKQGSP